MGWAELAVWPLLLLGSLAVRKARGDWTPTAFWEEVIASSVATAALVYLWRL